MRSLGEQQNQYQMESDAKKTMPANIKYPVQNEGAKRKLYWHYLGQVGEVCDHELDGKW